MQKVGLFQVIYTNYKTSTNRVRVKKQFIFLEEIATEGTSWDNFKACQEGFKRYSAYNNVILIDYDNINNGYIKTKSRNKSIKLLPIKGQLQEGEPIELLKRW